MSLLTTGSVLAAFLAGTVGGAVRPVLHRLPRPQLLGRGGEEPPLAAAAADVRLRRRPGRDHGAITLGISLVAGTIARYHAPFYYAGGALMLLLAAYSLSGRTWSLPSFLRAPDTRRGDSGSFFAPSAYSPASPPVAAPRYWPA